MQSRGKIVRDALFEVKGRIGFDMDACAHCHDNRTDPRRKLLAPFGTLKKIRPKINSRYVQ